MTAFALTRPPHMNAEDFIAWAVDQPDAGRCELVGGEVVAMAPERASHTRVKLNVAVALRVAIQDRGLHCEAFTEGMSVRISADTVYQPGALVRCGQRVAGDTVRVSDPVVLVEVLSPSARAYDAGAKLGGYFLLPSVRHYLLLDTRGHTVIHHARSGEGGPIATQVVRSGVVALDPPGMELDVAELFLGAEGDG